jgi:putative hydrolase of the HAD superfamily
MARTVFFDAAGTLFEAREPIGRTYTRLARQFGLDASEEAVSASFRLAFGNAPGLAFGPGYLPAELRRLERQWWRARVLETFSHLGEFRDFDPYFEALFSYFANPAHWEPVFEAASTLLRLRDSGLELGVISNFDFRLYRILEGLNLARYFDSFTISSEAGYAKPRREIFDAALRRHGASANDALHVGDSEHLDFDAAQNAGLHAILINPAIQSAPIVSERAARISSLAQVLQVAQVFGFA